MIAIAMARKYDKSPLTAKRLAGIVRALSEGKTILAACGGSESLTLRIRRMRLENAELEMIFQEALFQPKKRKAQRVCEYIKQGFSIHLACVSAGVSTVTFQRWRQLYPMVAEMVKEARG